MISPGLLAALPAVCLAIAAAWAPPARPVPLLEFVTWFRWTEGISVRNGEGDRIDPTRHPAHWYTLDAIGDALLGRGPFRRFALIKPTQDGGTWITITMPLLYCTTQVRQPAVAGFPDMRLAGIAWRQKMRAPVIKAGRSDWLPTEGPGSDGNSTPVEVALRSVPLYFIGGGASNEAGQASLTGMLLTRDERDSMDPDVAALMGGRLDGFDDRGVTIDTSTIKADVEADSQIWAEYRLGTMYRIAWPCVHCGGYQVWSWDQVTYDGSTQLAAMRSVALRCVHEDCRKLITDADRCSVISIDRARLVGRGQTLQRDGTVTGELPETLTWSLLWTALDSPIKSLSTLAGEHWAAAKAVEAGDHTKMRKFERDRMCRFYAVAAGGSNLDATALALRSVKSGLRRMLVPAGTRAITVTGDVQKRELWWLAIAHGDGGRWWIIDYGREVVTADWRAEPSAEEVHAALDAVAARVAQGWPDADGEVHHATLRGIDSRYQSAIVRAWLEAQGGAWLAVRGSGEGALSDRPKGRGVQRIEGWIDVRETEDGWLVHYVDAAVVKDVVHAGLAREPGAGGSGHLPAGEPADGWLIKQLTAERKIDGEWVKVRKDNHLFDCAVYGLSLGQLALHQPSVEEQVPVWGR